jgi:hypothetical protein
MYGSVEDASEALRALARLYPQVVFHRSEGNWLTIIHRQGLEIPKALKFHAGYRIEVGPDSIRIVKDREGIIREGSSEAWAHFQGCVGLPQDGIPGPATLRKVREIYDLTDAPAPSSDPQRRSAWERLAGPDPFKD